ncbi:oxygenase MpaB family protein [Actinokineospora sp. UTMC 2448]|uniref:oxygenase MpaB family protein n=1 Tax=Actinokineospora sp. UTMC 2448 TaxID=2268449 RepID=UPI0021647E7E|nr:oxygenase MpaB family protein [Actinokineospora sp. UTMC 2448]UVS79900.1 Latex clearing protein precursor [Actinokineospora sp. UTMC 2448]
MTSTEALEALKFQGDPQADAVIADLVASGRSRAVNAVLAHFRGNDQPIPEELPESVRAFLIATDNPPAWADPRRLARAYEFFVDDGVHVASVLTFGAMVNCYAHPRAARALTLTHGLNQPHRRLSETSQFVLSMMGRDAFGTGGGFVPAVQKTRLIHAAVRHLLTTSGRWDVAADGVPVCQQDMLGALLIFSVQVIQGMRRIGISVTEEEAEDYYYVWRVAGEMLGIPASAVPESLAEARDLSATLVEAAYGPSTEGTALTRDLLALYERLFPGKVFDGIIAAMVRQVVNPEVADWMRVPRSRAWGRVVRTGTRLVRLAEGAEDSSELAEAVLDRAGALLLGGSVRTLTTGQSTTLTIPTDLRERWAAAGKCPAHSPEPTLT